MKNFQFLFALLVASAFLFSCGDDDDDDDNGPGFIDQPIQGMINGQSWQAGSGLAEVASFEDNAIDIEITDLTVDDVCDEFFIEGLRLFFDVPDAVGTYELGIDTEESITLYDPEGSLNIIVLEGTIEILTIDATEGGTVTGRIDGRSDDENFVNGNFTVTYCPE